MFKDVKGFDTSIIKKGIPVSITGVYNNANIAYAPFGLMLPGTSKAGIIVEANAFEIKVVDSNESVKTYNIDEFLGDDPDLKIELYIIDSNSENEKLNDLKDKIIRLIFDTDSVDKDDISSLIDDVWEEFKKRSL